MTKLAQLLNAWMETSPNADGSCGPERRNAWEKYCAERDLVGGAYTCDDNVCPWKGVTHTHLDPDFDPYMHGVRFAPISDRILKKNFNGKVADHSDIKSRRRRMSQGKKGENAVCILEHMEESGMSYDSPHYGQKTARILM